MDLETYVGTSPARDHTLTVEHVTHHRRWSPKRESTGVCPNCGTEFELADRHVLLTLTAEDGEDAARHYFCAEDCVEEWLDAS